MQLWKLGFYHLCQQSVVLYDYHNDRVEDRWIGHDREITKVIYL